MLTATSMLRASLCERKSIGKQSGKSFVGFDYNLTLHILQTNSHFTLAWNQASISLRFLAATAS